MKDKKNVTPLINISVLIPEELAEYVEKIAEREQTSKAWAIRKIIREHKQVYTLQAKPPVIKKGTE